MRLSARLIVLSESQLPPFVRVLSILSATIAFATATAVNAANLDGSISGISAVTEVSASLWSYNYKSSAFDETRFVVNPITMTLVALSHPSRNSESLKVQRRRANAEVYNLLQHQLNEVAASERDPALVAALLEIEKAKTWGKLPGDQLLVSPNGRRLVLQPDMGSPVVVNLDTLRTLQIVSRIDPLYIPMAWSPDSRRLAIAPSETKDIVIYDVERGVVESKFPGFWVQAITWSPDMKSLALMTLVNRRLYKSPKALVAAAAGHPDFRNDLILETRTIATQKRQFVALKSNLDEQSPSEYWIEWH